MTGRARIIEFPIIEPESIFLSRWPGAVVALIVVAFGTGLIMRQLSLDDPMPTYVSAGLLGVALACFFALRFLRRPCVYLAGDALVVETGEGKQRVLLANLASQGVRVLDLSRYCDFNNEGRPWRAALTCATRSTQTLLNGERAILLITDRQRVRRLRSFRDDITLLLSLKEPEKLRRLLSADPDVSSAGHATPKSLLAR